MPSYEILKTALYICTSLLELATAALLIRRNLIREYPVFSCYMIFHVTRSMVFYWLFYLHKLHRVSYAAYFYSYWAVELISMTLAFVIIYQIFSQIFGPFAALQRFGCALFRIGAGILLGIAIITTAVSPAADSERIVAAILLLDRNVAILQAGLLLLLFLGTSYLGLSWRSATLGIALGFGMWACIDLAVISERAYIGVIGSETASLLRSLAYGLAVLTWFIYMLPLPRVPQASAPPPHANLQRWNDALRELLSQ
jgi:hypothetical protein